MRSRNLTLKAKEEPECDSTEIGYITLGRQKMLQFLWKFTSVLFPLGLLPFREDWHVQSTW